MDKDQRNRIGYILDLTFYIILPIIFIIIYCSNRESFNKLEDGYNVLSAIFFIIEAVGIVVITKMKKDENHTSFEERKEFELQMSKEVEVIPALLGNMFIVLTSFGAGTLWYYSYMYLGKISILVMILVFIMAVFIFNCSGNKLYKANIRSKTMFWAGALCLMLALLAFLVTLVSYTAQYIIWVLFMTVTIIFLFLGIGYCVSSYRIRKENKK